MKILFEHISIIISTKAIAVSFLYLFVSVFVSAQTLKKTKGGRKIRTDLFRLFFEDRIKTK